MGAGCSANGLAPCLGRRLMVYRRGEDGLQQARCNVLSGRIRSIRPGALHQESMGAKVPTGRASYTSHHINQRSSGEADLAVAADHLHALGYGAILPLARTFIISARVRNCFSDNRRTCCVGTQGTTSRSGKGKLWARGQQKVKWAATSGRMDIVE